MAALSQLCSVEDVDDLADGEQSALEIILDVMNYDPSPEVRKAALSNVHLTPETLRAILVRTRDTDLTVRKVIYDSVLAKHITIVVGDDQTEVMGLTHPRGMTIAQRETIVRNGLGDRVPVVKAAAEKLLAIWVDVVGSTKADAEDNMSHTAEKQLLNFLAMFDLAEGKIAEDALISVLKSRPDLFESLAFEEANHYWQDLNPERAFLARVFVHYCLTSKNEARLEDANIPVVTALAFMIQSSYNSLMADLHSNAIEEGGLEEEEEEKRMDREFVLGELLKLAVDADYGDEIGRRKMFMLVRGFFFPI